MKYLNIYGFGQNKLISLPCCLTVLVNKESEAVEHNWLSHHYQHCVCVCT